LPLAIKRKTTTTKKKEVTIPAMFFSCGETTSESIANTITQAANNIADDRNQAEPLS
jgi:hypothetical protein